MFLKYCKPNRNRPTKPHRLTVTLTDRSFLPPSTLAGSDQQRLRTARRRNDPHKAPRGEDSQAGTASPLRALPSLEAAAAAAPGVAGAATGAGEEKEEEGVPVPTGHGGAAGDQEVPALHRDAPPLRALRPAGAWSSPLLCQSELSPSVWLTGSHPSLSLCVHDLDR